MQYNRASLGIDAVEEVPVEETEENRSVIGSGLDGQLTDEGAADAGENQELVAGLGEGEGGGESGEESAAVVTGRGGRCNGLSDDDGITGYNNLPTRRGGFGGPVGVGVGGDHEAQRHDIDTNGALTNLRAMDCHWILE